MSPLILPQIASGGLTTTWAVMILVFFRSIPTRSTIHVGLAYIITQLWVFLAGFAKLNFCSYPLTLLVSLNFRQIDTNPQGRGSSGNAPPSPVTPTSSHRTAAISLAVQQVRTVHGAPESDDDLAEKDLEGRLLAFAGRSVMLCSSLPARSQTRRPFSKSGVWSSCSLYHEQGSLSSCSVMCGLIRDRM
jgi:hypothetical protein